MTLKEFIAVVILVGLGILVLWATGMWTPGS